MADLESLFERLAQLQEETTYVTFAHHYVDGLWKFRLTNGIEFAGKNHIFTLDSVIGYILKNRIANISKHSKNKKPYTLLGV